jgi:dTDP-4-dehydrorhamnose reductase
VHGVSDFASSDDGCLGRPGRRAIAIWIRTARRRELERTAQAAADDLVDDPGYRRGVTLVPGPRTDHLGVRSVLVTGLRGTVGQALDARLQRAGVRVVGWDRAAVAIDHYDAMLRFVETTAPDALVHLAIASSPTGRANEGWQVNHEWPSELAWITRQLGIRFVHASTVMVFSDAATGPFTADSVPDATEGYGLEKRMAEQRVMHQNPDATIVRLGWQIGTQPGSNQMIDFFDRETRARGEVRASTQWRPACSFLDDTADAIARLLGEAPGRYLLDSNTRWTFFEIAQALSALHGDRWSIVPTEHPTQDQRMIDPRVPIASLATRLPALSR